MEEIVVEPLTVGRIADYLCYFETKAFTDNPHWASCFCYFPLHDPEVTDWQKRTGLQNREAVIDCITAGRASGYLAYLDGEVVGWCNAGPRGLYPMLNGEPHRGSTGVVFCFVVAPEYRSRGIAARLLEAACDGLRVQGLDSVEARPSKTAVGAAANHLGPLGMYLRAGFSIIDEDDDGTVRVRKELR